jgi:DNA invertase Pin-like site-specific DNA recombinase
VKLVAYVRVSTNGQAEEGFGLHVQERAVRRWARDHGHRLVAITRDEGISGTLDESGRPGLAEALEMIASGRAEGLGVPKLDRLARSLTVQEAALAHVWRSGGRVFSVDAGEVLADDPDDPMRTAMRQMVGVFGQLERGMIAARLRAGRRLKGEQGGYAAGAPPFGMRARERALIADDDEQRALERIRELRAGGKSLRQIADVLESEGVRAKRGGRWTVGALGRIAKRLEAA